MSDLRVLERLISDIEATLTALQQARAKIQHAQRWQPYESTDPQRLGALIQGLETAEREAVDQLDQARNQLAAWKQYEEKAE